LDQSQTSVIEQVPIIELRNINKSFNSEVILNNFNFTLDQNQFVTILGPSGSGKTTIIKLIAGFELIDEGEIILNGVRVNDLAPNKREVNTVFQNYSLFPHMSVYENIAFGLKMKKKDKAYIDNAVRDVLKIIKMEKFADRKPDQLSGGQQQRVAVARAIVNKPLILLLDEPLSALDEKLRKEMQTELKQMQKDLGITFILVTHDQEEALSISDTVIVVNNGNIEQIGSPSEIYENPVNSFVAGFVGELNVLDAVIKSKDSDYITLLLEDECLYKMPNKQNVKGNFEEKFEINDKVKLLLRPENLKLTPLRLDSHNASEAADNPQVLKGRLNEVRYRGALLDYLITLNNNKKIIATSFHNKTEGVADYAEGAEIIIEWIADKEVLTK